MIKAQSLKPMPLYQSQVRPPCPICGVPSYSRDGIHPQCAVQQADEPRSAELRRKKKEQSQAQQLAPRTWEKKCPKCKAQIHVRRSRCDCGYLFTS
jgi:hypothetical protein